MTRAFRRGRGVAIAAIALAALAACTGASTPSTPSTSGTASVSASTSSSPTSTTASPAQVAEEDARGMVARFYRDADRGIFEPTKTNPSFFEGSSTGTALVENENTLNAVKAQRVHQTGETKLKWVKHVKTDLAIDLKSTPPTVPVVTFLVCYDVSGVDIVDSKGKSVVPDSRKPTGVNLVGVANREYPSPDGWRVAYVQPKDDKC